MKKYLPAFVAFFCLIAVTLAFFIFTVKLVQSRSQLEFDRLAAARVSVVKRSLKDKYLILESIHSAYTALGGIPTPEFALMSKPFESEASGVLGYRWIAPISGAGLERFEKQIGLEFNDFKIIERNMAGDLIKAESRPMHYILMPLPGVEPDTFSGFDLAADPHTLKAIEHSIEIMGVASTGYLPIGRRVDGSAHDYLFQAYVPVYSELSSLPLGLIAGLFNLADIVSSSVAGLEPQGINLTLMDLENGKGKTTFSSDEEGADVKNQGLFPSGLFIPEQYNVTFELGGRAWSFIAEPTPRYMVASSFASPWLALIAGLLLSFILSVYFAVYIRQNNRIAKAQQEVKDMQIQLYRTQKMEAVGRLASGIAHDFNNILTGVLGYSYLAQEHLNNSQDDELKDYLQEVVKAGARGQDLVSKLSAFNRNKPSTSTLHDVSPLVNNALKLLRPTISSGIVINYTAEKGLPQVVVDPTNFEQIVMNLCINARDSILDDELNENSCIDISLRETKIPAVECNSCNKSAEGEYIVLSVKDSGKGISEEALGMIFTPFYTSKETGKGTGMGLSIIHGIVHSYGGHIIINSKQGHGTEFQVLFPIDSSKMIEMEAIA